jgi:hypothetical protein
MERAKLQPVFPDYFVRPSFASAVRNSCRSRLPAYSAAAWD